MLGADRFYRRFFFFLFFLIISEVIVRVYFPRLNPRMFQKQYRLPAKNGYIMMPDYVDFIRHGKKRSAHQQRVIFLGSSPTYGHKIFKSANTYPYTFEAVYNHTRNRSGKKVIAYNLASDGQMLADQYYILKSIIDAADVVFVQINYHTFNPKARENNSFYPEMPEELGVAVAADEALLLKRRPTPKGNLNAYLRTFARRLWVFYRERERLAVEILGKRPKVFIHDWILQKFRGLSKETMSRFDEQANVSFFELSPAKQMVIIRRYAEVNDYTIQPNNLELFFLKKITRLLRQRHIKGIFFMTPLNVEALNVHEIMDWDKYRQNSAKIAAVVRRDQFLFLDYNLRHQLPGELFADISHTLDDGGKLVGRYLSEDTAKYLETGNDL